MLDASQFTPEDFAFFRKPVEAPTALDRAFTRAAHLAQDLSDDRDVRDLENLRARCDALESTQRNDAAALEALQFLADERADEIEQLKYQLRQAERRYSKLVARDFSIPALRQAVVDVVTQETRTLLGVELAADKAQHFAGNVLQAVMWSIDPAAESEAA